MKKKKKPFIDSVRLMYILAAVVGFIAVVLLIWFGTKQIGTRVQGDAIITIGDENQQVIQRACDISHPLTGECIESSEPIPVVAVMVENHIDAQPLSGIADASIVYEAPVEGSIPRFLAIYPVSSTVAKVGPVRSARPYYLDWVSEYPGAMYMHVGGSPEALEKIDQFGLFDLNEFYRGWYYWRSQDRYAPHNAYTSSELWQAAHARYAASSTDYAIDSWQFASMEPCDSDCVTDIILSFGGGGYNPSWTYNAEEGYFERYQFGRRHRDADGTPYIADTILVMNVEADVLDAVGRLGINVQAGGSGYVIRDGYAIEATWKKDARTERTKWFDESGNEIALKSGKIWVEVISQFNAITIKTESL